MTQGRAETKTLPKAGIPVRLTPAQQRQIESLAALTGMSCEQVIDDALSEFRSLMLVEAPRDIAC